MKYYNLIIRVEDAHGKESFLKYRKVNRVEPLLALIRTKHHKITYINYYDNKTKEFIRSERTLQ